MSLAHTLLIAICVVATLFPSGKTSDAAPSAPRYAITDLGTLGGGASDAVDINDHGQIVGASETGGGVTHGFLWERGKMTDLGAAAPGVTSDVRGINGEGIVLEELLPGDGTVHAVLWRGGRVRDLGSTGGGYGEVSAINDRGQVIGLCTGPGQQRHAFLWMSGPLWMGDHLCDNSFSAKAVNNVGMVVGILSVGRGANTSYHTFLWNAGRVTDLGLFGGTFGTCAINDLGQVVGEVADVKGYDHQAALWQNSTVTRLPRLDATDSAAGSINDRRQIVGWGDLPIAITGKAGAPRHAFLWEAGHAFDLNTLIPVAARWKLVQAQHINNEGQIVGWGLHFGRERAFLLTPADSPKSRTFLGRQARVHSDIGPH